MTEEVLQGVDPETGKPIAVRIFKEVPAYRTFRKAFMRNRKLSLPQLKGIP
jgi:hypothetical protein